MKPYQPANLVDDIPVPPPKRPASIVLFAFASIAMVVFVLVSSYSPELTSFAKRSVGPEIPSLIVLSGVFMCLWLIKPSIRMLGLAGLLNFLIGAAFYFRMTAHNTLWGTDGQFYDSLVWGTLSFIGCGLFLVFSVARLVVMAAKCERMTRKQESLDDGGAGVAQPLRQ